MTIAFPNALYNPKRHTGNRVHIEQVVGKLTGLGHTVWVPRSSAVRSGRRAPWDPIRTTLRLRRADIVYVRMEGFPVELTMDRYWRKALFGKPLAWEVNAAPDLRAYQDGQVDAAKLRDLDRAVAAQAASVSIAVCNTAGLAEFAKRAGVRHTAVVPLASDPTHFTPHGPRHPEIPVGAGSLNVLWMGNSQIPWHDFGTIVEAIARLHSEPSIRFFIAGKAPAQLDLPDNLTLLGERAYTEMPSLLRSMDVGLAIYRRPTWSRFGVFSSPLKVFDYLASGMVVVASPIEQIRACIRNGENGLTVPFDEPQALAETLRDLLGNADLRRKLGANGRKLVEDYYNWDRVGRETADILAAAPPCPKRGASSAW